MVERITRDIEGADGFKLRVEFELTLIGEASAMSLTGEIVKGSIVKTLNRTRAVYGRVIHVDKRRRATVEGRTQAGARLEKVRAHVEDLDLIPEGELCPEDR